MALLASLAVGFVAFIHVYILVLEMFLWATPRGLKAFGLSKDLAIKTKALAANQGLYNGFLSVGLVWGLQHPVPEFGKQIQLFFLAFVATAGIFGAATAKAKILFVQTVPATLAIGVVFWEIDERCGLGPWAMTCDTCEEILHMIANDRDRGFHLLGKEMVDRSKFWSRG
ncbi:hypothetical protein LHYA1_G008069 [Lachnellula hyalina]|uniref:DUF1304 domain-containing protein n=1 Tax=Lachnellula hyalina TaxID=1316788 RepID=A0A8H8TVV4_9HELO|nr:uncharacterized protein LHYA1_G008069 [Lachnellula hyalina]TVY23772.1 hypothetical protein LHYA1_G008069 [Lachnellula hyalina]